MTQTQFEVGGLNVVVMKTDKFKTTDLLINFRNLLKRENVTKRGILPNILKSGSRNFPSKQAISRELERLYGASFGSSLIKQGQQQILSFKMSLVNDAYLSENAQLLDDAFKLLADILFQPLVENGAFSEKVVKTEKRLLANYFESLYDNKIRYAYNKLLSHMYKDENYKLQAIGLEEDVETLSPQNLYETYQKMLKEDTVDLFVVGDVDEARVRKLVETYFPTFDHRTDLPVLDKEEKKIDKVNEVIEEQEVSQAKLNLGFRTHVRGLDPDYDALVVMNGILGGYPHSLLFKNVREKHSLCYYISSNVDRAKGAMYIYAGIAADDYKKALDLTLEQVEVMKKGEFNEEVFENTKNAIINDFLEMNDTPSELLANNFASLLYGEVYDVKKRVERIRAVQFDDVKKVAEKIELDTIFLLTEKGVNE